MYIPPRIPMLYILSYIHFIRKNPLTISLDFLLFVSFDFLANYNLFLHNLPRTRLYIETNPIQVGDKLIGFQAKYYSDSVSMSGKENELSDAVKGAARAYPGITTLYFYISQEFYPA